MQKKLYLIYIIVVATFLTGCGAEQAMKKGDKFYALGEYYDAAEQYKKAYAQTPSKDRKTRGQRALKLAECYRRINYTQKAIAAYNNAVRYRDEYMFVASKADDDGRARVMVLDRDYHLRLMEPLGTWSKDYFPLRPVRGWMFTYPKWSEVIKKAKI